jgi:hypothetical protein
VFCSTSSQTLRKWNPFRIIPEVVVRE